MAITIAARETVQAAALAILRNRFPGRDLTDVAFLGKLSASEAVFIYNLMQAVANADADGVPGSKISAAGLAAWAQAVGTPTQTAGVYGAKTATLALGATGTLTGTNATSYPDVSILIAADGVTQFKLNGGGAPVVIPGSAPGTGSISGTIDALTAGTVGNVKVNDVLTWQNAPSGSDATVKITAVPATLGIDVESFTSLLTRTQQKMQTPPKGGTSADFRAYVESQSGVSRGFPYPLRGGLGTVHIMITGSGSGKARDPGATIATSVTNAVNGTSSVPGLRNVTIQGFTVLRPYFVATGMLIRARMIIAANKYNWDWIDTVGGPFTVASYSVGTGTGGADQLVLNVAPPASMTAAVDAASKPRLQVLSTATGATATPYVVQVTKYSGASNKTLDLQNPLPTGWVAPNNGDSVYAAGPGTATAAAAILAYVDGLGSSRSGGYAETTDFWESTCAIARLTQIAIDAADTNGVRFFSNIVTSGVTIAYNGGAAAAIDITASDTTANGPELLFCKAGGIAVTQ